MSSEEFKVVQPTTKVYSEELGWGTTLTGITARSERCSVQFESCRKVLDAAEIIDVLIPQAEARSQQE